MLLFAHVAMSTQPLNPTAPQRLFRAGDEGFEKELATNIEGIIKRVGGLNIDLRKLEHLTISDIDTMELMIDLGKLQVKCPGKFKRNLKLAREQLTKGIRPFGGSAPVAAVVPIDVRVGGLQQRTVNEPEQDVKAMQLLNELESNLEVLQVIKSLYFRVPPAFSIRDPQSAPGKRLSLMINTK
jgi:hypothetical protein